MSFTSGSGTRAKPTVRPVDSAPFHEVRGAVSGAAPTATRGSRRPWATRLTAPTVFPMSLGRLMVRRSLDAAAYPSSSNSLGMWSGSVGGAGSGSGASAVRLNRCTMSSAPEAPSMAEWWTLVTMPMRPCLRPSTTHSSQSGRLRSSGELAICPAISPSSRRPPGAGQPIRRMW